MIIYTATLKSQGPIQFSRHHGLPKKPKESDEDHDNRTWQDKAHYNENGNVIIPAIFFKNSLMAIAKYISVKVPGKKNATYTKHFEAGVMVIEPLVLPYRREDLTDVIVFGSSTGVRDSGKRVPKRYPTLFDWEGTVDYQVVDTTITEKAFAEHLVNCGKFQGLGVWRPRNGGNYGRFMVKNIKKTEVSSEEEDIMNLYK